MSMQAVKKEICGRTPLSVAAKRNHYPVVEYLPKKGANPNLATVKGLTALHYAAASGSKELLGLLVSNGANVNAISESVGTQLHCAACGNEEAVRVLLKYNANPNIAILGMPTPLGNSIVYRAFQCVKLLVEGRADVNTSSAEYTPLELAVDIGEYKIIKYLLDHGADPNVNVTGSTLLEIAGYRGNHKAVTILFPLTPRLSLFDEWSIKGIKEHYKQNGLDKDKISGLMSKASFNGESKKYYRTFQKCTGMIIERDKVLHLVEKLCSQVTECVNEVCGQLALGHEVHCETCMNERYAYSLVKGELYRHCSRGRKYKKLVEFDYSLDTRYYFKMLCKVCDILDKLDKEVAKRKRAERVAVQALLLLSQMPPRP